MDDSADGSIPKVELPLKNVRIEGKKVFFHGNDASRLVGAYSPGVFTDTKLQRKTYRLSVVALRCKLSQRSIFKSIRCEVYR